MNKVAPSLPRIAAMVVFALSTVGLLLLLWITFGGTTPLAPKGYRFDVQFAEATQLAEQADVRIAGVPVGRVVDVEPGVNRTVATIELDDAYAPIPEDARAMLRIKTLLGETYVELTPGTASAERLPEGGALPVGAVRDTVELDEIFQAFDPRTREDFQAWMQAQAAATDGRGADINAFFGELPGWVDEMTELTATLDAQESATREMIANTATFFDAISARDGELRGLVTDAERLFSATAARNGELAAIFRELPRFERESIETLPLLTAFGRDAQPVIEQLQPAASEMTPVFQSLERLGPEFEAFFGVLPEVIRRSERGIPAFESILGELPPLLEAFGPFLRNANPMIEYIAANEREVTAFFANTTAASLARDVALPRTQRAIHYLRTSQTLSPEALSYLPRPLGSTRLNAYMAPDGMELLRTGLRVFDAMTCGKGEPAPPTSADPATLVALIAPYVFRTDGRDVAAPVCAAQGDFPGFLTQYPQLRAEP